MKTPDPVPLYPTYEELQGMRLADYPQTQAFLDCGPAWRLQHWQWGLDFLNYIGRNKSEHTFTRFRGEVEKFLLWLFLFHDKPADDLRKADILAFADFCWKPPLSWIGLTSADRFVPVSGVYEANPHWRPFRIKAPKKQQLEEADKKRYRPSQQTILGLFTAIIAFYKHLMNEELCYGNPAQLAKNDCRYLIKDAQVKEVRRLTDEQWRYVLKTTEEMADTDPVYERTLFVVATLKTLFLRVSELSERSDWSPEMGHFWQDYDENWWLKVYGKGRKIRDVSVPTEYFAYLSRYRRARGLPAYPFPGDNAPLVEKIRGQGGMTARQLTRIVQQAFDLSYEKMKKHSGEERARKLHEASSHWLRHTGASMEVQRGRALKDLSEDLGHASMATTDTIYVQSENRFRAASGKKRTVE